MPDDNTKKTMTGGDFNHIREQRIAPLRAKAMDLFKANFIIWANPEGIILGLDNEARKVIGISHDQKISGESLFDLFQEEYREDLKAQVLARENVDLGIFQFKKDLEFVTLSPFILDSIFEEIWIIGRVREEAKMPSRLTENSVVTESYLYLDERFHLREVSEGLAMSLGYSQREIAGIKLVETILPRLKEFIEEAKKAGGSPVSWTILGSKGQRFKAMLKFVIHPNLSPMRYEIGVRKMTLQESDSDASPSKSSPEEQLYDLLDASELPVLLLNKGLKVFYANPMASKPDALFYRKKMSILDKVNEISREDFLRGFKDNFKNRVFNLVDIYFDVPNPSNLEAFDLHVKRLSTDFFLVVFLSSNGIDLKSKQDELEAGLRAFYSEHTDSKEHKTVPKEESRNTEVVEMERNDELQRALDTSNGKNLALQNQVTDLQDKLSERQAKLSSVESELSAMKARLNDLQSRVDRLKEALDQRDRELEAERAARARDRAEFEAALKQAEAQRLAEAEMAAAALQAKKAELASSLEQQKVLVAQNEALKEELAQPIPAVAEVGLDNSLSFMTGMFARMQPLLERIKADSSDADAVQQLADYGKFFELFKDIKVKGIDAVDIVPLAQSMQREIRSQLPASTDLYLAFASESDFEPVAVGYEQLKIVLEQLVKNSQEAIELTEEEGEIKIKASMVEVHENEDLDPGKYLLLRVADNGVGFGESESQAVEEFYTTKEAHCGLGLSLVKYLVAEKWGGQLNLFSGKQGAVVEIYLPVIQNDVEEEIPIEDDTSLEGESFLEEESGSENLPEEVEDEKFGVVKLLSPRPIFLEDSRDAVFQHKAREALREEGYRLVDDVALADVVVVDGSWGADAEHQKLIQSMSLAVLLLNPEEKALYRNQVNQMPGKYQVFSRGDGILAFLSFMETNMPK